MAARSSAEAAPYLPFSGGGHKLALGLMALAESEWLELDDDFAAQLAEKRALLDTRPDEVVLSLSACDAPARELLALLAAHLPQHHPALYTRDGNILSNRVTGEQWDVASPSLHPLDLCGRLAQEDFCIITESADSFILAGATLAAPARWRLADKLGRPLVAIHAPVPGYDTTLARPVDRFLAHLKEGRLTWRLNWGVVDDPARFQPVPPPRAEGITPEIAGERLWLRVERQTLRKLPATGAVVFTIRTHITRLDRAITTSAGAADLASAVRSLSPEMERYKAIEPFAPALLAWLVDRARATT